MRGRLSAGNHPLPTPDQQGDVNASAHQPISPSGHQPIRLPGCLVARLPGWWSFVVGRCQSSPVVLSRTIFAMIQHRPVIPAVHIQTSMDDRSSLLPRTMSSSTSPAAQTHPMKILFVTGVSNLDLHGQNPGPSRQGFAVGGWFRSLDGFYSSSASLKSYITMPRFGEIFGANWGTSLIRSDMYSFQIASHLANAS